MVHDCGLHTLQCLFKTTKVYTKLIVNEADSAYLQQCDLQPDAPVFETGLHRFSPVKFEYMSS